ncbi:MAG: transporter substrate-binding domain-containing protein [Rhodobacteraceae bacterium]|nr:transporter substrate-binding domain-containing protein [Paracoccaceae bacterium]
MLRTRSVPPLSAAATLAVCLAFPAAAQTLCEPYTVARGDTLSQIAKRAGVAGGYQAVFELNANILSNPNRIEVGQVLQMPCPDGAAPSARTAEAEPAAAAPGEPAAAEPPAAAATAEAAPPETAPPEPAAPEAVAAAAPPAPAEPPAGPAPIRFVTGTFPPWSGQDLPQQGFFTELITTALERSGTGLTAEITYVEDWNAHLDVLLPSLAYDMTYPWALPDCTRIENLEPSNARRCTDFDATDPFISAPTGFYVLKGSSFEGATSFPQLLGARLCRPEGHFTFDLEAERLMPPNAELIQPPTPAECWTALAAGTVDVVTYAVLTAEEDIVAAGMQDKVVPTALETVQTTHVFIAKNNPRSAELIGALNAGLAQMRANGEWFEIVSRHLSEREARLGQGG